MTRAANGKPDAPALRRCARPGPRACPSHGWPVVALLALTLAGAAAAHEPHPYGITALDWEAEHVARTLTSAQDFQNEAVVLTWTGPGRVETIEGRRCLVGGFFLFDVDDQYAFDLDEPVTLDLLFDRRESDGFVVIHDRGGGVPAAQRVELPAEGARWRKAQVTLERARFANRLHAGTDVGIAALGTGLFYEADADHELALCGLRLARSGKTPAPAPAGTLDLTIRAAADGETLAARVGVYDARDRLPLPGEDAVVVRRFTDRVRQLPLMPSREPWPGPGRWVFYADGRYRAELPAGRYRIVAGRGPEYRVGRRSVTIEAGKTTRLTMELSRFADMPARGWYAGDGHVHIARDRADDPAIAAQMRAEDLHLTNLLQMSNIVRTHFPQYAFGPAGYHLEGTHALVAGQESPRTGHRGHTIGLDGRRYHAPERYFLYDEVARAVRRDGGLYGYAHVMIDAFHASRGLALDVPAGLVDFVEVLQFGELGTALWYDFLNLGFAINPLAGSDFPYINAPGTERSYVRIDGTFTPAAWFEGLRAGHTFVTNGPLLELTVAGQGMGARLETRSGATLAVRARARLNPDYGALARLELIVHGEVVASARSETGARELTLAHELPAQRSCWLAVRAFGPDGAAAHSAPVYVMVDGEARFWKPEAVPDLIAKYRGRIRELLAKEPLPREDLESWVTGEALLAAWRRQHAALAGYAGRVLERYDALLDELDPR